MSAPGPSILAKADPELDPETVAPGAAVAMVLAGGLALGWVTLTPRGEPLPAFIDAVRPTSDWVLGAVVAWVMLLGASKRCFGFGRASLAGWALGFGVPVGTALLLPPPWAAAGMVAAVVLGLLAPGRVDRWRYWIALAVAAFGFALFRAGAIGFVLDPMPRGFPGLAPRAAAWAATVAGFVGGALVALTARRGDR